MYSLPLREMLHKLDPPKMSTNRAPVPGELFLSDRPQMHSSEGARRLVVVRETGGPESVRSLTSQRLTAITTTFVASSG
jgi:hypothetical protein